MKKWLISKYDRRCRKCDTTKGKATVDASGRTTATCSKCGDVRSGQSTRYYTQRACEKCRYVRRVTVTIWTNGTEHAARVCNACDLSDRAGVHEYMAYKLAKKASVIRAARRAE